MKDKVKIRLIASTDGVITPDKARAIGMDIEDSVQHIEEYTLHYAIYEEGEYEEGLRVEVQAYWDRIGGYYLHDMQIHGDYDPGDACLIEELMEGIFRREQEYEIWCEDPITMSLSTY